MLSLLYLLIETILLMLLLLSLFYIMYQTIILILTNQSTLYIESKNSTDAHSTQSTLYIDSNGYRTISTDTQQFKQFLNIPTTIYLYIELTISTISLNTT